MADTETEVPAEEEKVTEVEGQESQPDTAHHQGKPRVLQVVREQFGRKVVLAEVPITGADEVELVEDVLRVQNPEESQTAIESIDASIEEAEAKLDAVKAQLDQVQSQGEAVEEEPAPKATARTTATAKKSTAKK